MADSPASETTETETAETETETTISALFSTQSGSIEHRLYCLERVQSYTRVCMARAEHFQSFCVLSA